MGFYVKVHDTTYKKSIEELHVIDGVEQKTIQFGPDCAWITVQIDENKVEAAKEAISKITGYIKITPLL